MEFIKSGNAFQYHNEAGELLAEISYALTDDEHIVIANHTYVSPVLRGQGVAEKLLNHLVAEMDKAGIKIQPQCSYVVGKFEREPDEYDFINANK